LSVLGFAMIFLAWVSTYPDEEHVGIKSHSAMAVSCILSSALSGIGQSLIWVGQGEYISLCATEKTSGFYFGYFWVYYMSA
jgi:hypothetical protein